MKTYMRFPSWKEKVLTFSYDDGVYQDVRLVKILEKYGLKGTFNINSGYFSPEGTEEKSGKGIHTRMPESVCKKLYENHEVAIHAFSHPFLEQLPCGECVKEIIEDRKNLEKMTGKIIRGMAYPFGTYNDDVVNALKACGIVYSRTTVSTERFNMPTDWLRLPATCHHNNPRLMELAKDFSRPVMPHYPAKMFYLWGHSYEFDNNDNWDVIENFADYMAGRDDTWYATNIEIYDYTEKYRRLIFNAESTMCYNPTDTELFMLAGDKTVSVAPGETVTL